MKISFVTPAYNAEATLRRCLDSLLSQTDGDWEVIIVDDGSKDNTYEIACAYAKKDRRIVALTQENQGPGMTRNNAMRHASGDYIAFLDSDDYIEPDYVALVKEKIIGDNLDVVILDNYYEDPNGKLIRMETLSQYAGLDKDALIAVQMTGKMPWGGWRKVIKADIIRSNQIEYSKDAVGEEALFSFRAFYHAERIGFLGKPVLHYVDYPASQSKKGNDDPWGGVVDRLRKYLSEQGLLDRYSRQVNSFAYTALAVSVYRIANNHPFREAIAPIRDKIKLVKQNYHYDCDPACMETRVKLLMPLIRLNCVMPMLLIAKLKRLLK